MSKSTGNFLTLSQAVAKYSADGMYAVHWINTLLMIGINEPWGCTM